MPLFSDKQEFVNQKLGKDNSYVFSGLPQRIQQQLLLERDAHGNVQVSRIDTEAHAGRDGQRNRSPSGR